MTIVTLPPGRQLARLLHPASDADRVGVIPTEALHAIASGLSGWASAVHHTVPGEPGTRRYARLVATPAYEAWLIVWPSTTGLGLHDHGVSAGVLRVVQGELIEAFTDRERPGPLRTRRVGAGQSVTLPPTRVHAVWNPVPATAVTVHVYAPPLVPPTSGP